MDWNAAWIWHPATEDPDNFCMYARKELSLSRPPKGATVLVTASSMYKLYVNGHYVGRGPAALRALCPLWRLLPGLAVPRPFAGAFDSVVEGMGAVPIPRIDRRMRLPV